MYDILYITYYILYIIYFILYLNDSQHYVYRSDAASGTQWSGSQQWRQSEMVQTANTSFATEWYRHQQKAVLTKYLSARSIETSNAWDRKCNCDFSFHWLLMSQIATGCLRAFLIVALVHYLVSYDFLFFTSSVSYLIKLIMEYVCK